MEHVSPNICEHQGPVAVLSDESTADEFLPGFWGDSAGVGEGFEVLSVLWGHVPTSQRASRARCGRKGFFQSIIAHSSASRFPAAPYASANASPDDAYQ